MVIASIAGRQIGAAPKPGNGRENTGIARNRYPLPTFRKKGPRSADETGIKIGLRLWGWVRLQGDDDDWELVNASGARAAVVRQDGERYWVARPRRAIPEPPLESLEKAKLRAERYALAALPLPRPVEQPKGPHPLARAAPSQSSMPVDLGR